MSIFSFESKLEKDLRKNRSEYEKTIDRAVRKAKIDDVYIEQFFKSEGGKIFLGYLKNDRDICLRAMRESPKYEDIYRLQERYAIRCSDIDMLEAYVARVEST